MVLISICGGIGTYNSGYTKTTQVFPYTLVMVPTTSIVNSSDNTNPGGGYASVSANDQLATAISYAIDYTNPIVLDFARNQIQTSDAGAYNIAQICDVWEAIYNRWTYVRRVSAFKDVTPASRTIDGGLNGNCLNYAILNAAAIESVGGRTRVTITQNALGESHAYAEVFLTNNTTELESIENYLAMRYPGTTMHYLSVHSQANGEYWMTLDWQANYPGALLFHDNGEFCSYYPSGHYSCHTD